jgi:hypothetical protein
MKIWKGWIPALALLWVLGPLGSPAQGADLGIEIDVEVDSGSGFVPIGTATGGGSTLDVSVSPGDKVKFIMFLLGTPDDSVLQLYETNVTADDATEIDYIVGSGEELTGLGFHVTRNPDNQLTDGTPGFGFVDSAVGSVALSAGLSFYSLEYTVQSGVNSDALVDFSVKLENLASSPGNDTAARNGTETARVRLNRDPSSIPALSLNGLALFLILATGGVLVYRRRRAA